MVNKKLLPLLQRNISSEITYFIILYNKGARFYYFFSKSHNVFLTLINKYLHENYPQDQSN